MILLKATEQLEMIFRRLIRTLGVKVEWNGVFIIADSRLILPGRVRSLFFDYETRRVYTNIEEFNINIGDAEESEGNDVLANAINMALYAFGKWGSIGLKVDKDYRQLNQLFYNILKEARVEPDYREENCRFYCNHILITYEDVIEKVIAWGKPQEEAPLEEEDGRPEESKDSAEIEEDNESLGLWHRLIWKKEKARFVKSVRSKEEEEQARLGHNFYMVDYQCPVCGHKLYMVVYPVNGEFLIETKEGRMYLARAYTCKECRSFHTPVPGKLLAEGDIYSYYFEEDKKAYEDYQELLGAKGGRYSNYKFNEWEAQRQEDGRPQEESLSEVCENQEEVSLEGWTKAQEKIDAGFYPQEEVKKYAGHVKTALHKLKTARMQEENEKEKEENLSENREKERKEERRQKIPTLTRRRKEELPSMEKKEYETIRKKSRSEMPVANEAGSDGYSGYARQKGEKLPVESPAGSSHAGKKNASTAVFFRPEEEFSEGMQGNRQKERVGAKENAEEERQKPSAAPENRTERMRREAKACRTKSYEAIGKAIEDWKKEGEMDAEQTSMLFRLEDLRRRKGENELSSLLAGLPESMDIKHYELYKEKLKQYKDLNVEPVEKELEERRDRTECKEIGEFVKRAPKKDRSDLSRLYEDLKKQGFREKNTAPFLENIRNKIYEMDQEAIRKICPDVMSLSFEEALKAYDEIKEGLFLPELKTNTLEMLEKRLTRMKTDENGQLIRKFTREMEGRIKNDGRLHFYDAGNMLKNRVEETEASILNQAVETYGMGRNPYEYPLLIGDSSKKETGKEGFILTPDHIFYCTKLTEGKLRVMDVEEVTPAKGKLGNAISIQVKDGGRKKIPAAVPKEERQALSDVLQEFISYLQEKPESREIKYLAQERHAIKCCLRCGYQYRDGNICPKCGSKANK